MASNNFINECKNRGFKNRLAIIDVENETPVTNSDYLQDITISDACCVNRSIIGSTFVKSAEMNIIDDSISQNMLEKILRPQIGVRYADNSTEYINMGKYVVERPINEQTANMAKIIAYDDFNKLDNKYVCNLDFENEEITIADFYIDVCSQLGLTPKTTTFINSNLVIPGNPFTNNETLRFVLSDIEEVACSFSEIDWDTNEIDLVWLSDSQEPDYVFETSDYATLKGGEIQYGPVNSLVIRDSQIEGENVSIDDPESIEDDGLTELTISDNYFLYTQELRSQAINAIWQRIKGLTYIDYELETYYGKPFLKCGSRVGINTNENNYFESYVLTHQFKYDGTFYSKITAPALTKQETAMKNELSLQEKVRRTEQITNKITGEIEEIVEEQTEQGNLISQTIQSVAAIKSLFQITGGSNLIKNSQFLLTDEVWNINASDGYVTPLGQGYNANLIGKTISIANIVMKDATISTKTGNISNLKINQLYNFHFFYSLDANTSATVRLYGANSGRKIYNQTFTEVATLEEISLSFNALDTDYILEITTSTTLSGYFTIYDLMINSGDKKSWEPAMSEIYSTVLKMSQLGLQIYASGSNTLTLMTSMGFKVYKSNSGEIGEVVTEFTDKGLITGEIEAKTSIKNGTWVEKEMSINSYSTLVEYQEG